MKLLIKPVNNPSTADHSDLKGQPEFAETELISLGA
jgi:hypothetical protein